MTDRASTDTSREPYERRGFVLGERYVAEHEIANGGMGTVYAGRDTVLDRPVAIKVLRAGQGPGPADLFLREARAVAQLKHRHIVDVYDAGVEGDISYIVMEYVPGETLKERLAREGPLDPLRAARIAAEVADALDYAHRRGIVHCDVKPGNILLPAEDLPKLVDFGIARKSDATGVFDGLVIGTAEYMSPEQVEGEQPDGRADVYSLAAVLYEMLTGAPPFTGSDASAVLMSRLVRLPAAPHERNAAVPRALSDLVMHGLERERDRRYATAGELAADLQEFTNSATQAATRRVPLTPPAADEELTTLFRYDQPPPRRGGRRTALWAVLAVVVAVLGGAGVGGALLASGVVGAEKASVTVPNLVNQPIDDARDRLTELGLSVRFVDFQDSQQPFGTVFEQDPPAGMRVKKDSGVLIRVSNRAGNGR